MNVKYLLPMALASSVLFGCGVGNEPTVCTSAPQSDWMNQEEFQANLIAGGYQIKEFKVTEGNCYEIYGRDSSDNKVEIYFNPLDGSIVKQETH